MLRGTKLTFSERPSLYLSSVNRHYWFSARNSVRLLKTKLYVITASPRAARARKWLAVRVLRHECMSLTNQNNPELFGS